MKNSLIGLLLAFQFFTSIPVRKQLPMNRQTVTSMYFLMPVIGVLMGGTSVLIVILNESYFQFSGLFLAIILVVANIVMTGGLHLDGWIDLGDAFFSYQDQKRRLEILDDSRVGAFGAICLVVLLLLKVAFLYEFFLRAVENHLIYFVVIPFISRLSILIYFLTMKNVKQTGLAAYFKSQVNHKQVWFGICLYSIFLVFTSTSMSNIFLLFFSMIVVVFFYRYWTLKNFGGMTGDLMGALYEGVELVLWGILLLFI
ncbi:cobalamin-5'-phosphate synthase [Ureibacillus xyleni]|uniref:Adenosylcobinamide-GDP ribazoletransferase n=1 Tax=Ureibacillus xyleni TaxID=614648 RepID=A0A285TFL4_9BACL|nr:adenosylcobinamide-GDP ribazoletransferase [Ureibacillus xyleni]SOC20970.1 cobalamin-5'-phosphate synthase [Ureibacillus xyleni]